MKTVRLDKNIVVEVIPDYGLPVEEWYGEDFAKQCKEAPDEVDQYWVYDHESGTFSEPPATPPVAPEPVLTLEERVDNVEKSKADQTAVDELNEALHMILTGVTE